MKKINKRRAPGQQYLKQTLTNCLTVITSNDNMQLEVNPLKVFFNSSSHNLI